MGLASFSRLVAAIPEEIAEQFGTFGFEDAFFDYNGMVEAIVCEGVVEATGVTGLRVWGSVDETIYAGGVGGSGAHEAGLQGGI